MIQDESSKAVLNSEFVENLKSEYGIIQQKIDNIGDFKFKVRGWLITIYSAFIFGVFSTEVPVGLIVPLGLFIVFVFHMLEREQLIQQYILSNRAKKIEVSIYLLVQKLNDADSKKELIFKKVMRDIKSTPRIAVELTSKARPKKSIKSYPFPKGLKNRWNWFKNLVRRKLDPLWRKIKAYWLFVVLYFLTLLFYFLINTTIAEKWHLIKVRQKETTSLNLNIASNS